MTPAGKPSLKKRRRTRVLGPTASVQQPAATSVQPQFLSRRLQQAPQTLAVTSFRISAAQSQSVGPPTPAQTTSRNEADCMHLLRNSGRSASFFGNTPGDLLSDLVQAGSDPQLIDEAWVLNHSRWIVWKLAGYALHLPSLSAQLPAAPCDFSVNSLREQLRYRYDIEKGQGKRSVLRKIMDGDSGPSRPMVVCVASILEPGGNGHSGARLEVTDGWWPAVALLDDALTMRCRAGQIKVGDKLWVVGAQPPAKESKTELKPSANGELVLRFHANGTRKARQHSRLGWQRMSPRSFALPIRSLHPDGGSVCCMDVVIQRVYQTLYREQTNGGTTIFRDADAEGVASKRHQTRQDSRREEITNKIMQKHQDPSRRRDKGSSLAHGLESRGLDSLDDADLYMAVTSSNDPDAFAQSLTESQRHRLYRAMEQRRNEVATEIQAALEGDEHCAVRDVTQLFRVHLSDATVPSSPDFSNSQDSCVMTVWGCHEDTRRMFTEGRRLRLFNVHGANRSSGISCFNYRRDSQVEVVTTAGQLQNSPRAFIPRSPVLFDQLSDRGAGAQVDFTGVVLSLSSAATEMARAKGRMFVLDHTKTVLCLQTWQFTDAKLLGTARSNNSNGQQRQVLCTVEVRDAFYGGRDSWSGGTHLTYCTEDSALIYRNVQPLSGSRRPFSGSGRGRRVDTELDRWLASPAAIATIEVMEAQVSSCLEIEQAQFHTSIGSDVGAEVTTLVLDRSTVEFSGCLLANRCRADALPAAEALLSTQSTVGRRLTVSQDTTAAQSGTVVGEAHIWVSSSAAGAAGVQAAVVDHNVLTMMLGGVGVSKDPASDLLLHVGAAAAAAASSEQPAQQQQQPCCITRMVWRLVRDGICDCVGQQEVVTRYLPAPVVANRQQQSGAIVTPHLRGQLALHRAQTLQRHVSVRALEEQLLQPSGSSPSILALHVH